VTWRPSRAKTEREKTVRMMTSRRFFTDSMTAPTIVFKPKKKKKSMKTSQMRLCHPPDGSTSPQYKLLCFITTKKICKENALAFNWDRCCHLVLCLQLIPFHWDPFLQGILKGEVSLYHRPPVCLVWNQLYDNWQFLFLFAKHTNPKQSNRRSTVLWYFPL
jgi:hypothetical protein